MSIPHLLVTGEVNNLCNRYLRPPHQVLKAYQRPPIGCCFIAICIYIKPSQTYIAGLVLHVWSMVTEYNLWHMILKFCAWCLISNCYVLLASGGCQTRCFEKLHLAMGGVWRASGAMFWNVSKSGVRCNISKSSARRNFPIFKMLRLTGVWCNVLKSHLRRNVLK